MIVICMTAKLLTYPFMIDQNNTKINKFKLFMILNFLFFCLFYNYIDLSSAIYR